MTLRGGNHKRFLPTRNTVHDTEVIAEREEHWSFDPTKKLRGAWRKGSENTRAKRFAEFVA